MAGITGKAGACKITAKDVTRLLAIKHSKEVFVSECKTGPTWGAVYQKFDAWVMNRSYTNFTTIGYEIKVSRADFVQDSKWTGYLPFCHEFYFVAPPGIIQPSELPDGIGLYVTSKTGSRLFMKKKAARRDIEIPQEILIYILMSRSAVHHEWEAAEHDSLEYWKEWLRRKGEAEEVGYKVSKSLRDEIERRVKDVEKENASLKDKMLGYDEAIRFCEKHNITPSAGIEWRLERLIKDANGQEALNSAKYAITQLTNYADKLEGAIND